jgi:hypothetical protein
LKHSGSANFCSILAVLFYPDGSVLFWRCWLRDVQVCLDKNSGAKMAVGSTKKGR